ncbi:histidine kinase, partial [Parabacteroides sp. OttesenSCG-928-G21]|nr:histidine kinase [Parabacteroides sp. OttesenSCG-928-G21]
MATQETNIINLGASKRYSWLFHIIPWFLIMLIPILFQIGVGSVLWSWGAYFNFAATLVSFMLVFYINYYYLINKYLFTKRTGRYLLMNLIMILLLIVGDHIFDHIIDFEGGGGPPFGDDDFRGDGRNPGEQVQEIFGLNININILFYLVGGLVLTMFYAMIAAVSVAFKMTTTWYQTESARKELEKSRSEAELQNLKSQLNPHFLFNTLNNIYSLIALSPERAQEAVHDLSRLLRYVMYESSQPYVTLEKDLDFVRNYVELMRIRLPEHAELKTNISSVVPGTLIAPLLFISLIENAFKHGISNNKPSFIHIDIMQEGNQVICSIVNSDFH